jgi:orotidine-5'-phosphate decarboxylase
VNNLQIFVALDCSNELDAQNIINKLNPEFCGIKVGKELFTAVGPKIIDYIHNKGFKVFLDLKYHDIPNTVKKSCKNAADHGVYMLNVHSMGGSEMMLSAKEGVDQSQHKPVLIGVTILTSHDQKSIKDIGYDKPINHYIKNLALNVADCGLDGVVCSANDLSILKPILPEKFHLVTPGIRLENAEKHDQQRVSSPRDAKKLGSTMLVIGRSITENPHPLEVLKKIQLQLK